MTDKSKVISELKSSIDELSSGPTTRSVGPSHKQAEHSSYNTYSLSASSNDLDANAAFKKIVDLVNASDKSELQIRSRLSDKGFDEISIDEAVNRAKNYGFIDDRRYANVLIRSRISQGKGIAGIERELRSHNIEPIDVEGWPDEYFTSDEDELERALSYLDRKPPRSKNLRDGAFRKLVQKGYSTSIASSAARIWAERLR